MAVGENKTFADTLSDARIVARNVEKYGYKRFWIAEHHSLPGIASSATPILISDIAAATSSIRVGAGGVMLPNHSPLIVAEQFATLETLYPGRIDLGLGRAAGAAGPTVRALRGDASERNFEQDIDILRDYLLNSGNQPVSGIPGVYNIPMYILGSSMTSAELAARRGLPYSFAAHFAPHFLSQAVSYYRNNFQPSEYLDQPYVIVGVSAFAADTEEEAQYHASSHFQWTSLFHQAKQEFLPLPKEGFFQNLNELEQHILSERRAYSAIGNVEQVGHWLKQFIDYTQADELIVDARIYDPIARSRSYELIAQSLQS